MAKDSSFDIVSEFDKQELLNAVDQVKRDLLSRFDLKNSNSEKVRYNAARILGEMGDFNAVEPLINVLKKNPFHRKNLKSGGIQGFRTLRPDCTHRNTRFDIQYIVLFLFSERNLQLNMGKKA